MKTVFFGMLLLVVASTGCNSGSDASDNNDTDSSTKNSDTEPLGDPSPYTVTVDGKPIAIHRVSRFERPVNYLRFDYSDEIEMEISVEESFSEYKLSPEIRNIETKSDGNTVSFTISEPGYFIFRPDSLKERLLILIDPEEEDPPKRDDSDVVDIMDAEGIDNTGETVMTDVIQTAIDDIADSGKVLYFPPGIYLTGELFMKSKMTLYLSDGAILKGSSKLSDIVTDDDSGSVVEQCQHAIIRMNGITDSHLKGRGTIDANGVYHRDENDARTKYNLLKIEESDNCSVDGIIALDSSFWNTIIYRSDKIDITNYKVINNWLNVGWNETDGVDFDNATNSKLSNALLYTGDDCMATKSDDIPDDYVTPDGVDNYPPDPTQSSDDIAVNNVIHENVVCFTNQAACKIGTKTMGAEMSNVVFRNIDVVKCGRGLVIDNMDTALVHDITFDSVVFEYNAPYNAVYFVIQPGTDWRYSEGVGGIEDIVIKDVKYTDFPADLKLQFKIEGRSVDGTDPPEIYPIGKITFTDVYLNDLKLLDENIEDSIGLVSTEADDITFQ